MEYYCEVENIFEPDFVGSRIFAKTDEEALEVFQKKFGNRLEFVYDEEFRTIYEKEGV